MPATFHTTGFARALYAVSVLLLAAAALEFVVSVLPLQVGFVSWRVSTGTAFCAAAPVVVLGLALLAITAWVADDVAMLRVASALAVAHIVLLLLALAGLAVDALSLLEVASSEMRGPVRNQTVAAAFTAVLAVVSGASLARAAWRAAGHRDGVVERAVRKREEERGTTPLIRRIP
jgi:hypothetical protein